MGALVCPEDCGQKVEIQARLGFMDFGGYEFSLLRLPRWIEEGFLDCASRLLRGAKEKKSVGSLRSE
jgi:hypothetical protein